MKILKTIFGRFVIIALTIIIQVALLAYILIELSARFIYLYVALNIISYLIVLGIINLPTNPSHKIPWLVFILVLPIPGVVAYFMFSGQILPKKFSKDMSALYDLLSRYQKDYTIDVPKDVKNQMKYIEVSSRIKPTINNKTKYYNSGEAMYKDILEDLRNAKEYIFFEFFILSPGYMLDEIVEILKQKVKENVIVRIIYDDIGSIKHLPHNFNTKLEKLGIKCLKFSPFIPFVSSVHNNRDHRKSIIIDGNITYTGGINIADEYINKIMPFGYWKDNGLKIEGDAVRNYLIMFLTMWNTYYHKKDTDFDIFFKENNISNNNLCFPFGDGPKPMYKEQIGENVYLNIINESKDYIYITTPYLIVDYNLTNALKNAALRGVDVRIVTPHIPDKRMVFWITRSNYIELIEAGVKIYEYTPGFIHSKMILSDDKVSIIGTINFDYRSLVHHFECASFMYNIDSYKTMLQDFKDIIEISQQITLDVAKNFNKYNSLIVGIIKFFSPLL